jgi:ribosomal protein S18 acetylase RimI-like enzyme
MTQDFSIQVMSRAQLDMAVEWAAREGWNPGLNDAALFHAADPHGFLVGVVDGEPVACIAVVRYGEAYGFLGFYIALPAWRGKGLGFSVWQAGLAHLGTRTIGLDGVVAQQENYRRSGFQLAHRNIRYGGHPQIAKPALPLADPATISFDKLTAYDRRFFPAPRDGFLSGWLTAPGHRSLAVVQNGELQGLGTIRPCREGHKVGPLYAATPQIAEALFASLAGGCSSPVFLDVPETNPAAVKLAEAAGLKPAFETARMYRGAAPKIDMTGLYGITTFELG